MPKLSLRTQKRTLDGSEKLAAEIRLQGFIDPANFQAFERGLEAAAATEAVFLLLDFTGVHYINSTGISALIRYFEEFQARGGTLCLAGVSKSVGLSMHLLGVTAFIPFVKDLRAARAYARDFERGRSGELPLSTDVGREERRPGQPRQVVLREPPRPPGERGSVLVVVPSNTRFTRVLRLRFGTVNGDYHLLHGAAEALQRYGDINPDLVVLDERCDPKGEFVSRLKVEKGRSLTSIIKIYGRGREVRADLDFKIWENDFLVDPFELMELFSLSEAELLRVPKDRRVFVQQVHFEFKTKPENVEKAYKLSDRIVRVGMPDEEDGTALYAAIKEGIDNAVIHGNRRQPQRSVDVNFLVDHEKVTVIIEDEGEGFDSQYYLSRIDNREAFEEAKRRILEGGTRGGLGILLMSKCTDRIEYSGPGNILRLEKNIRTA